MPSSTSGSQTYEVTKTVSHSSSPSPPPPPPEQNYNAGPTSWLPVWRLQTVEEQRELLAMEHIVDCAGEGQIKSEVKSEMKRELHDVLDVAAAAMPGESLQQCVPVLHYMQFGFPNPLAGRKGADGSTVGPLVFNARSETVEQVAMWRQLVHKKRCVVCVDGFFEFHTEFDARSGDVARKQPYFFHLPGGGPQPPAIAVGKKAQSTGESPFPMMYLAALYDASVDDQTGELHYSFCILTCEPSKEMRPIHTRMPVILSREAARQWVDVEAHPFAEVSSLLVPFEGLSFYKVPPLLNSGRNRGVECIEPLDLYEKRQKASGLARFFTPLPKAAKPKEATSSSAGLASAVSAAAADAQVDSFFNLIGSPGVLFPLSATSSSVNPADPGAVTGDQRTATTLPSSLTSDAADRAECFVQQVKREAEAPLHNEHKSESRSPSMPLKRERAHDQSAIAGQSEQPSPKRVKHNTSES